MFRCTYVLPDGVTFTKGFVKEPEEAKRYMSLYDPSPLQATETQNSVEHGKNNDDPDSRKRIDVSKVDLTKNVIFGIMNLFVS